MPTDSALLLLLLLLLLLEMMVMMTIVRCWRHSTFSMDSQHL